MDGKEQYVGYLGTTAKNAGVIIQNSFERAYKHGRFGDGIYLVEESIPLAIESAAKIMTAIDTVAVIKCDILVDENEVLDMTSPSSDGTNRYYVRWNQLIEAIRQRKWRTKFPNMQNLNEAVINSFCELGECKLIRATTCISTLNERIFNALPNVPNAIELCVKDESIITYKQRLELEYII